ncbi:MAG: ADP-ribosylglycohydrolase family protein [Ruminococcaceae bacterium]|nr:ADP-ribosylglycohydrolase family protein [Oscillospiraceae bacterium]
MRAVGCLVGGAVGDALGYAVEFAEDSAIFRKYGERGITEYQAVGGVAQISDDTQMTLFTAEGLLSRVRRGDPVGAIHQSYLNWLKTQTERAPIAAEGLMSLSELYSRRAPGNTCLSALESGLRGSVARPINRSKGCGGIMRVAPVAIYCHSRSIPIEEADLLGAEAAAITHGHPLGYIPAAFFVHLLYRALEGTDLDSAVKDALLRVPVLFEESEHSAMAVELVRRAVTLAEQDLDDLDAIRALGEGWVAEETLAIALYCCLKHRTDFAETVIAAVNHSGDSDSTGAVAGNLIGACLGVQSIPRKYLQGLELLDTTVELARALCEA